MLVRSYFLRRVSGIYVKVLKWGISHLGPNMCILGRRSRQPLIRKHSYLDHRYPGGLAFIPILLTPGWGWRSKSRTSLKSVFFYFLARLYEVQGKLLKSPRSSASASPSHCDKVLHASFSKVHISTATHQKAFIFGP